MDKTSFVLEHNGQNSTFEFNIGGSIAFIEYEKDGGVFNLLHTIVPEELEGQGIAASLVEQTFRYLEENHLKIIPSCSYIQLYLKRHPEWKRLLA